MEVLTTLLGPGLAGSLIGALLVYLATRQKTTSDEKVARERIEDDADIARAKLLAEATATLYEQQNRYIVDLQNQAAVVSSRLEGIDAKLRDAQAAVLKAYQDNLELVQKAGQEKAELTAQLRASLAELSEVKAQLAETRAKLAEAQAANRNLLDRLAERQGGAS